MTDTFQQINRTFVRWKNRIYSYFGGCDYFRLASHQAGHAGLADGPEKIWPQCRRLAPDDGEPRRLRTTGGGAGGFFWRAGGNPGFQRLRRLRRRGPGAARPVFAACSWMKKRTAVCAMPAANSAARLSLSNTATPPAWPASWPAAARRTNR